MELKIDAGFKSLIPPLSDEERQQLEANLVADGCREPLVVWQGTIVDGHNRFEICTRRNVAFQVVEKQFENRQQVEDWIDANQLGRRNLRPEQMSLLRGRRYNRTKKTVTNAEGIGGKSGKIVDYQNDKQQTTAERLAEQHGVSKATIVRDGKFAEAVEALELESEVASGAVDASKQVIVEAAKPLLEAKKQNRIPTPEETAKARTHVVHNSGENEWYTPLVFLDAAREVLGKIDLDPASCEVAQKNVKAKQFYSVDDDGLTKTWKGSVYMNPPYSKDLCSKFVTKLLDSLNEGTVTSAIILVNNATETAWAQPLLDDATAVCFPGGRIKFLDRSGKPANTPLQGQMFVYLGPDAGKFRAVFQKFGSVLIGNGCEAKDAKATSLVKQFKKMANKLDFLKQLTAEMQSHEKSVLTEWLAS